MRRYIFILLILFISPDISGQKVNVDSLENSLLVSTVRDTNRAITLFKLCWQYRIGDPVKAERYGNEALKISMELEFQRGIGSSYNNLGALYESQGDDVKALKYYVLALDAKRKTGDKKSLASTLNNIGIIYKKQEHFERALAYYQEAASLNNVSGNKSFLLINYYNIANCHKELKHIDSAFYYYNLSSALVPETGSHYQMADILNSIGNYYNDVKDYTTALVYFDSGYAYLKEHNITRDMHIYYHGKARSFINLNQLDSALVYLNKSWEQKKDSKDWSSINVICQLWTLYYEARFKESNDINDLKLSQYYFHLAYSSRDSLLNVQKMNTIFDLVTEDMIKQKNAEIEAAQREKELESLKATNEKQFKNFSIAISVAAVLVLIVLYSRYRKNKLLSRKLAEQNVQIEGKNREIIDSITYAKRLQEAILPPAGFLKQFFPQSFILYLPKDIVAGDFYWAETAGDKIYIAAADCTGHGVPGAMVSVVCANALDRSVKEFALRDTSAILDKTRTLVVQTFEKSAEMVNDGMDISLLSLSLNNEDLSAQWSGANNPVWIIRNGAVLEHKGDKQPVGRFEQNKPFTAHELQLKKGDWIYLLTDGYADQFGGDKGKKFKYSALKEKLVSITAMNGDQQMEELKKTLLGWRGNLEQVDDICIIGLSL